jgi:hypothetical protein
VADLDRGLEPQSSPAVRARVALAHLAEVREASLEVASRLHAAQMVAGAIRAGDELPLAQSVVGHDFDGHADGADRTGIRTERLPNLVLGRRTKRLAERLDHLPLVEAVVAAHEREHDAPVSDTGIAFEVAASSIPSIRARSSIVVAPGVSTSSGASSAAGNSGARGIPRAISRSAA